MILIRVQDVVNTLIKFSFCGVATLISVHYLFLSFIYFHNAIRFRVVKMQVSFCKNVHTLPLLNESNLKRILHIDGASVLTTEVM